MDLGLSTLQTPNASWHVLIDGLAKPSSSLDMDEQSQSVRNYKGADLG